MINKIIIMKHFNLNENEFNNIINECVKNVLAKNTTYLNEGRYLSNLKAYKEKVQPVMDKLTDTFYGDKKGTINKIQTDMYDLENSPITNDLQIKSGLFSIGNAKLSPDTLIINFTSGLNCPSVKLCPVTQKACYAVAGEIRLKDVRRKNLMVQNMWYQAIKNDAISEVFGIAQMYIEITQSTNKPIKYIRFNEVGDFINQKILDAAALFASEMKKQYGVISMAYTANSKLDFAKKINGQSIDKIIKINASRLDIKLSKDSTKNSFLATPMDYKSALTQNDKVVSINEDDIEENNLKCLGVVDDPINNTPSIPVLSKGKWSGGSGWYYVCPCSFWGYNKTKATLKEFKKLNLIDDTVDYLSDDEISKILKSLPETKRKQIKSITNKIKSPCGTQCAVCHNMVGGISQKDSKYSPDKWTLIKNFTVLEATHGATSKNFKKDYAASKRLGDDNVEYSKGNKYGRLTKYSKK